MTDPLPEAKLPISWNDEARLNVLFAPFRSRSVNPKDWDTKLQFWKNLTLIYCTHHKKYSFTLPELTKIFTKNGRPPACLNVVVDDMLRCGEIKPLGEFLVKPAETWGSWAADLLIKKPIVWSFKKLKDSVISPDNNVMYVHVLAVEQNALGICKNLPEDLKVNIVDLKRLMKDLELGDEENSQYIIHFLSCQKKISVRQVQSGKDQVTLIKFCDTKYSDITESDVDIYTLELSEKALVNTIDKLEEEANKLVKDVKNYLLAGKKQLAKTTLRKKHELDRTIEKRANTLHNIHILLSRLRDAETDGHVLTSYKQALASLRRTFKETGLNENSAAETMLDLEEVMEIQKDVQEAMTFQTDIANDRELEEELEDLLVEENTEKSSKAALTDIDALEKDLRGLELISPPDNNPVVSEVDQNKSISKEMQQ